MGIITLINSSKTQINLLFLINSSIMNLLEKIKSGILTPIGWGSGQMLKNRKYIHDFELTFTIDTRSNINEKHGIKVESPSILEEIDRKKYVLIIYSVEFLSEVYSYCEKYPDLICLPFNSDSLGTKANLDKLKSAYETFVHHGISYINIKQENHEISRVL